MIVHVQVTADDISQGHRYDLADCPIARAVKRAGFIDKISVTGLSIYLLSQCHWTVRTSAIIPNFIQDWIIDFDRKFDVDPIEFDIDAPEILLKNCGRHLVELSLQEA
jgi:hypothetical protein